MEITEVRIKLMESSEDRLRGFCSITLDGCFVVRDLKIIDGNSGPFVAMPSRKLTSNCSKCRTKNHMRANYCNQCGQKLRHTRPQQGADGRAKLYADIAHPINAKCREMIQLRVIEELRKERALSQKPGYRSRYDESYDSGPDVGPDELAQETPRQKSAPAKADQSKPAKPDQSKAAKADQSKPDSASEKTRVDSSQEKQPAPHQEKETPSAPPANSGNSDGTTGARDDFGKGVFD